MYKALLASFFVIYLAFPSKSNAQLHFSEIHGQRWAWGCTPNECFLTLPIEITAQPNDIFAAVRGCTNSTLCVEVIKQLVGLIDQGSVPATENYIKLYNSVTPNTSNGSEHSIYIGSLAGYKVCNLKWHVWSMNGPGTYISASHSYSRREVGLYANVPIRKLGQGQTWVKAIIQVGYVKEQYFSIPGCQGAIHGSNHYGDIVMSVPGGPFTGGHQGP
jgi:hypothetical protein